MKIKAKVNCETEMTSRFKMETKMENHSRSFEITPVAKM